MMQERAKQIVADDMIFAERLTAEMKRQELSYRELAEKMGITVTTLFRYAKGQRVPKATEIVKASRALCVTCDYLIGLSDDPHKTSKESAYCPVSFDTDFISRQQAKGGKTMLLNDEVFVKDKNLFIWPSRENKMQADLSGIEKVIIIDRQGDHKEFFADGPEIHKKLKEARKRNKTYEEAEKLLKEQNNAGN